MTPRKSTLAFVLVLLAARESVPQVIPCAAFGLLTNSGLETNLSFWSTDPAAAWSPDDARGSAESGSVQIAVSEVASAAITQCVQVKGGERYSLHVAIRIDAGQAVGKAGIVARWYSDTSCTDELADFPDSTYVTHAPEWTTQGLTPTTPNEARSALIELRATKESGPGGSTFTANLDDASFAFIGSPDCADPICGFTGPSTSDAQHILRASVGLHSCPACYCDVNGSGAVSVSDSQATLRASVELPVDLACPACD
jgi:hypothetical protein